MSVVLHDAQPFETIGAAMRFGLTHVHPIEEKEFKKISCR
jgi:hypothetical protein